MSDQSADYDHTAAFSLTCDPDRARRLRAALAEEIGEIDGDRSRARLVDGIDIETETEADGDVTVAVETRDLSAVRAATDTWLGLLEAADRTVSVAAREREP
jgi:tRNA threonylcarbamoyladenosine modification (KEOPS) complex  Pcc1 subunit